MNTTVILLLVAGVVVLVYGIFIVSLNLRVKKMQARALTQGLHFSTSLPHAIGVYWYWFTGQPNKSFEMTGQLKGVNVRVYDQLGMLPVLRRVKIELDGKEYSRKTLKRGLVSEVGEVVVELLAAVIGRMP